MCQDDANRRINQPPEALKGGEGCQPWDAESLCKLGKAGQWFLS